ncbi:MAG TPA: PilZ domain-containing protein, partial [Myxococcales bacterium]|nr:PilZ domain-containing protein [Myxococcales bacterium]
MVKSPAARYPTSLPVVFSAPETFQPGYAANISAGGMFLRTDGRLAVGALLSVKLELPDGGSPAPVQGKVVHVVAPGRVRPGGSGAGVGIQFMASDDPVRRRVDRYIELLAETTLALQRPKRTHYPRLQAPVYWTPVGLPLFRRRKTSIEDLGGVLVYLDEKLKEGARLKIEVFLPDGTSVVCKAEVDWIDR